MRVSHKWRFVCNIQLGWNRSWKPTQSIPSSYDVDSSLVSQKALFVTRSLENSKSVYGLKNVAIDHLYVIYVIIC